MSPGRPIVKKDVHRRGTADRVDAISMLRPVVDARIHAEAVFIGGDVAKTGRHARKAGCPHVDRGVHLLRQRNEIPTQPRGEERLKYQERREPEGIGANHHPACPLQRERYGKER